MPIGSWVVGLRKVLISDFGKGKLVISPNYSLIRLNVLFGVKLSLKLVLEMYSRLGFGRK